MESKPEAAALAADYIKIYYEVDEDSGENGYPDNWLLNFEGVYGKMRFKFVVVRPNEHTVDEYLGIADCKNDLPCYLRNGSGGIEIYETNQIEFEAGPSGGGGDVHLSVRLPLELVAESMRKVILRAEKCKLGFAEKSSNPSYNARKDLQKRP